jgi:hypothetical protein
MAGTSAATSDHNDGSCILKMAEKDRNSNLELPYQLQLQSTLPRLPSCEERRNVNFVLSYCYLSYSYYYRQLNLLSRRTEPKHLENP